MHELMIAMQFQAMTHLLCHQKMFLTPSSQGLHFSPLAFHSSQGNSMSYAISDCQDPWSCFLARQCWYTDLSFPCNVTQSDTPARQDSLLILDIMDWRRVVQVCRSDIGSSQFTQGVIGCCATNIMLIDSSSININHETPSLPSTACIISSNIWHRRQDVCFCSGESKSYTFQSLDKRPRLRDHIKSHDWIRTTGVFCMNLARKAFPFWASQLKGSSKEDCKAGERRALW